jgi:hypothetical protein
MSTFYSSSASTEFLLNFTSLVEDNISSEDNHLTTTNAYFQNKTNLPELLKGILHYEIKWKYSGNIYKA